LTQADAAKRLRISKARLNTYCHDSAGGNRPAPNAEVLCRACVDLGLEFEYGGYKITAATVRQTRAKPTVARQLSLQFDDQFDLTDDKGTVSVTFRRPPGRVELSISVKATA
jgi:transcriptional regulator with XRE-family HTH domain